MKGLFARVGLAGLAIAGWMAVGHAQTASILPSAETQFSDANGAPYAGGKVYLYVPGTTTPKNSWQDPNTTTLNTNPVILDSAGRAIIWGSGQYREVLQDSLGNTIWDQLTYAINPSSANGFANGTLAGNTSGSTGGLNSITVGSGLTLSGSVLSVISAYQTIVADSTSQSVVSGFNNSQHVATGTLTYTLPLSSTLPNGFIFKIYALTGNITIAPYASDTIQGQSVGANLVVAQGSVLTLTTNASGTWYYSNSAIPPIEPPCGRLTLVTAQPVLASPATSIGSLFYTPYNCSTVPVVVNGSMVNLPFTEYSQSLTDTSLSPAAATAGGLYDVFEWLNGTSVVFTRGPAWTNSTSRGYSLNRVNGFLVNATGVTNGPASGAGVYVGTIAVDAGGATLTFNPQPTPASGGPTNGAWIGIWNQYNRIPLAAQVQDSKSTWPYNTATFRAADASNNNRITVVMGQAEDSSIVTYSGAISSSVFATCFVGVGVNSIASPSGVIGGVNDTTATNSITATYAGAPFLGLQYYQALEAGGGSGTQTWSGGQNMQLSASLRY